MSYILLEWTEFLVRWLHVIAGIAWIGSSFYFIALDLSLIKRKDIPKNAHGEAWQVHGGGFYQIVKYLVAPEKLPSQLTWFKWEAYGTWISGFLLLILVYYISADLYMIEIEKFDGNIGYKNIVVAWETSCTLIITTTLKSGETKEFNSTTKSASTSFTIGASMNKVYNSALDDYLNSI